MNRILNLQRLDVLSQNGVLGDSCTSSGSNCCNDNEKQN